MSKYINTIKLICVLLNIYTCFAQDQELQLKIMENHTLETPISNRELDLWETRGAAVMLKNQIVVVPEIADKKGAIFNRETNENKDQWIIEARVRIGNTAKTRKGGNGLGIYYLRGLDQDEIGNGLFGYSKDFDGLGVFLNGILSSRDGAKTVNYIQAFTNDGSQQINTMKLTQTDQNKNCKALFRNLENDDSFVFRIEYKKPTITIMFMDRSANDQWTTCLTMEYELDFNGIFLITGGSSIKNPDKINVETFALYNPQVKVSEGHNKHVHDAHKKKAIHDMAQFDTTHLTKDLIHATEKHFTKDQFGEENLLDMLPTQLSNTKNTLKVLLNEMYANYQYFYKVTAPLHQLKTFAEQIESIDTMVANMTELSAAIDQSKGRLEGLEQDILTRADGEFAKKDQNIQMTDSEKNEKFDDAMAEFESSINAITKKFAVVDRKLGAMGDLTDELHNSTDELEVLYKKDIEQRKNYFTEASGLEEPTKKPKVNLKQIDEIFDKVQAEEQKAASMIMFSLPNLSMLAVILLSAYIYWQLEKLGSSKGRMD